MVQAASSEPMLRVKLRVHLFDDRGRLNRMRDAEQRVARPSAVAVIAEDALGLLD